MTLLVIFQTFWPSDQLSFVFSLRTDDLYWLSLFQFVHEFSSQSTLKIDNFKFKDTQITFNDTHTQKQSLCAAFTFTFAFYV